MTDKIILRAVLECKKYIFPKSREMKLVFYRIYSIEELIPGYFGIREPIGFEDEKMNPNGIKKRY